MFNLTREINQVNEEVDSLRDNLESENSWSEREQGRFGKIPHLSGVPPVQFNMGELQEHTGVFLPHLRLPKVGNHPALHSTFPSQKIFILI